MKVMFLDAFSTLSSALSPSTEMSILSDYQLMFMKVTSGFLLVLCTFRTLEKWKVFSAFSDNCIPISWLGPFQTYLICVQLSWFCVVFPPVHLFGLCGVQFQVVYWTLRWLSLYLMLLCISHVCWLISQWKKLDAGCVVSKFNYGAGHVSCCTVGSPVKLNAFTTLRWTFEIFREEQMPRWGISVQQMLCLECQLLCETFSAFASSWVPCMEALLINQIQSLSFIFHDVDLLLKYRLSH